MAILIYQLTHTKAIRTFLATEDLKKHDKHINKK